MSPPKEQPTESKPQGITRVTVQGFKSIAEERSIEIRPLTILAGANSSGKSSMIQPLLLLKQTLEAPYDPGGLRLDGPHLVFTHVNQLLTRCLPEPLPPLTLGIQVGPVDALEARYTVDERRVLTVHDLTVHGPEGTVTLRPGMDDAEIGAAASNWMRTLVNELPDAGPGSWTVRPTRGLLEAWLRPPGMPDAAGGGSMGVRPAASLSRRIQEIIHVPGARRGPVRAYPRTATGPLYEGSFEPYIASLVELWQETDEDRLSRVVNGLVTLDLAQMIRARRVHDTAIELQVNRAPLADGTKIDDWVNVADVGLGLPHVLPVIIATVAADPERLVYVEEPEIHLHPRAQVGLASLLTAAADRGVRVVAETHSAMLLLAVQTLVANGTIGADKVALHWFERREDGVTDISTAQLDEAGAFGDWPEDFADVTLDAQGDYLDAVYAQRGLS